MKTRKRLTALALAALMLAAMALTAGAADGGDRSVFLPEGIELTAPDNGAAAEGYVLYENDHVKFSMEVPAAYEVLEPYENIMLVTAEDPTDFQVHAEYVFATVDNSHFLYDAQDFAEFIRLDGKQLTDWLGTEDIEVLGSGWGEVSGKQCYVCAFTMNGGDSSGALYLFDGQGDFGCYCVTAVINEKSDNAALYGQQLQHMIETFTVTGPYQMEGYTLYEREDKDVPVAFFVKDGASVSEGPDIYPVDGIFTDANIHIYRMSWEAGDGMEKALASVGRLYIDDYGGHYSAQNSYFDLGRYSYGMAEVEYEDDGKTYTYRAAVFLADGYYWQVSEKYTAEYADVVNDTFSDVLFSMRVGTPAPAQAQETQPAAEDTGAPAAASYAEPPWDDILGVLSDTMDRDNFYMDFDQQPLVCQSDRNGDGVWELLMVYLCKDGIDVYAMENVWLIDGNGPKCVSSGVLFHEVGGNSGTLSMAQKDGKLYAIIQTRQPDGSSFNDFANIISLKEGEAALGGEMISMNRTGVYGDEDNGQYVIDGGPVSRSEYEGTLNSFDVIYTIDILAGGDENYSDVVPFNTLFM